MAVILETSLGDLTIDLYTDERPRCCLNFLKLCKIKYYNFSLFHSIQRNLVAQTGDPTGTGRGGESLFAQLYGEQAKFFDMETTPRIKHKKHGTVSMVNNGSGMHGSQFFITLADSLDYLDGVHTVFGEVSEGLDVLSKINEVFCDTEHKPYIDTRIYHTIIIDDPFDDPPDLQIPDRSPEPTKEMLDSGRIAADEEIDDTKGKSEHEVNEMLAEKEAKANAQLLEMVGDLPSQDVKPPDNVLFVCKLNPVTTSEDLETIFSRFGEIISCEVIKDQRTGESLQYAFIEFEKEEDCENAYFKMDNVLIDDRRIHVDFSQSVSKMYHKKGKKAGDLELAGQSLILKNKGRRKDGYDLVFEDDESHRGSDKKMKKKKSKHRHASSESNSSDNGKNKQKHKKKKSRKNSSPPRRRSRSRSRSRDRSKKEREKLDYRREKEEYKRDRRRSYSPEEYKTYSRNRDDADRHRDTRQDRNRYR
ncbi:peptidyl-prolyl cis-trans isomerase-like 4 [Gigantopelta aegis]|uniref:peptidyl-prolyl cis-trans isomerase-like 4 n=1 Tax=Gigantopelta aegis TaxID=1735272 RepID=UPI001B88A23B|nr:peptidyl-prolyl cis-trans isomerase-like 4 [Gigantopelta aegis]